MARKRRKKKPSIPPLLAVTYISAALLIGFGWYAEVYWYQFRFISDGNSHAVAIAQGIALTLFLSVAAVMKKGVGKIALIAGLVAYSIFATAAGQSYSLELVRLENAAEDAKREAAERRIANIDASILVAENEIERLQGIKKEGAPSLADQSLWRTALANLNEDIEAEEEAITELTAEKLRIIDTGDVRPDDIYTRYSKLSGIPATIIESVFQLALSLFIALMAPVGLAMWPKPKQVEQTTKREGTKTQPKREEQEVKLTLSRQSVPDDVLEKYAAIRFQLNSDGSMPDHDHFPDESGVSLARYMDITETAEKRGLIEVRNRKHFPADMIGSREFLEGMK